MKKLLYILAFVLLSLVGNASQYWIGTGGSDANPGTQALPWLSATKVEALLDGDTINVVGTVSVPATVYYRNIKMFGIDTTQSIISITSTGAYGIYFWTNDYNSNQIEIKNIKFVGGLTANRALYIWKKHNTYIHNCSFSGFLLSGISFANTATPAVWSVGARFENNVVYDCAPFNNMNSASLSFIGQEAFLVKNCIIKNEPRGEAMPGALIKINYSKGGIIEENLLDVIGNNDGAGWAFAVEYWNSNGGDILRNNTIRGVIDLTGGTFTPGVYQYQTHIYGNTIGFESLQSTYRHGIYIEGTSKYVLIEDNIIKNVFLGFIVYTNSAHASNQITIRRNLITVGSTIGINYCYGIRQGGTSGFTMSNYSIYNNVISGVPGSTSELTSGILLPTNGTAINFELRNNIIQNFFHAPIKTASGTGTIAGLDITNNIYYNNGDGNTFYTTGGIIPTELVNIDNLQVNPLFVSSTDFNLQSGSPAIDAGYEMGEVFSGSATDIGLYEYASTLSSVAIGRVTITTSRSFTTIGLVTSEGGTAVTERGICYNTTGNPTTADTKVVFGSGLGGYSATITNLKQSTKYYIKAYSINSGGTSYSSEVDTTTKYSSYLVYKGKYITYKGKKLRY